MNGTDGGAPPAGWATATLGDIAAPTRPRQRPSEAPHLPFIGMEHVEANTMRLTATARAGEMRSSAVHAHPGDVLYGRLRPYLNKVYVAAAESMCSAEFIVLPATGGLNPNWLAYLLNSGQFVSFASHLPTGDRPRVDFGQIAPYSLLLPPRAEQDRIVAEIERQLTRLDAAVGALRRVQANLKRYRASVLKAACEGRLVPTEAELARSEGRTFETGEQLLARILKDRRAEWQAESKRPYKEPAPPDTSSVRKAPEGWAEVALAAAASLNPRSLDPAPPGHQLVSFLPMAGVEAGSGVADLTRLRPWREVARGYTRFQDGDVVFAKITPCMENGKAAVISGAAGGIGAGSTEFHVLRPEEGLRAKYLLFFLLQKTVRTSAQRAMRGAAGQLRVPPEFISGLAVRVPPTAEQDRIVAEVERLLTGAAAAAADCDRALARAERLRQAILKRAFEGKLVPQDPTEEPASVLLDRIRREREAAETPRRRPRRRPRRAHE